MNTDITASAKPEYPVIDRNPPFTKVVGNFNFLDYCRFSTITGVSVTVGYLSGAFSISLFVCTFQIRQIWMIQCCDVSDFRVWNG